MKAGRIAAISGGIAAVIGLGSATYQVVSETRDRRRFPPPGHLVDVGGHRLHIRCAGDRTPAVVIIPAMGGLVADWLAVQDALSAETAVCVYDRAGLGWSDAAPRWPSAAGMTRELHALLDAAGITRPVVLAGHSLGGLVARVYTRQYPEEVAGDRETVEQIDEVLVADETPGPTFSQRAQQGAISWREAAKLAETWNQERGESISRSQERIRQINNAWGVVRTVLEQSGRSYVKEILNGLGESDRQAFTEIVGRLKESAS